MICSAAVFIVFLRVIVETKHALRGGTRKSWPDTFYCIDRVVQKEKAWLKTRLLYISEKEVLI
jgi:hypothetical protein